MIVGILQFELLIHDAMSLKDKRRVVQSVKDRLHREHQVAVAEVGDPEAWNVAVMALTCIARERKRLHDVMDAVTHKLQRLTEAELGDTRRDFISGEAIEADDGGAAWTPAERRHPADRGGAAK